MVKTGAKSANGVIIDPFSGNILAMASLPSIDLNNYQNYPIGNQRNKVISDIYEPGSTYKIVTMAGKLELLNEFITFDLGMALVGSTLTHPLPSSKTSAHACVSFCLNL